jgi:predicted DNA-binding WGR domain protein
MLKMYKNDNGQLKYWEYWEDTVGKRATIHWGSVGQTGESEELGFSKLSELRRQLASRSDQARAEGYKEIDFEDHKVVLIEYSADGFGTPDNLEKRHRLQDRMDETLGWTGLGHCDGGSTGSGTMEVCCIVVDAEAAIRTIKTDLAGTEFADFSRVFVEV